MTTDHTSALTELARLVPTITRAVDDLAEIDEELHRLTRLLDVETDARAEVDAAASSVLDAWTRAIGARVRVRNVLNAATS